MADITLAASLCSTESSGLGDIWPKTSKTSRDSKVRSKESRYSRESSIVCEAPKDKWQRDPKLTLVAACDNCAIMDFEGGGPPYHGLDYQVRIFYNKSTNASGMNRTPLDSIFFTLGKSQRCGVHLHYEPYGPYFRTTD